MSQTPPKDNAESKLVHNERLKLSAGILNGIALAVIVAGAVTPLIALTYGLSGSGATLGNFLFSLGWLTADGSLHFVAIALLQGLKE